MAPYTTPPCVPAILVALLTRASTTVAGRCSARSAGASIWWDSCPGESSETILKKSLDYIS